MDAPFLQRHQTRQSESVFKPLKRKGASEMKITTIGIDLAKNVFQVHGVDERGKGPEAWPVHASLPLTYHSVPDIA
jgi:hypothetical protein